MNGVTYINIRFHDSSFLGQMIDDDDELVKLAIYFERKLDINEGFSNHNFDDWEDRINLLYNHLTSNI